MIFSRKKWLLFYNRFYYVFIFLLTIAILYAAFPKQANFKYEFQKGKPWQHQSLIAPFDFPILKTKEAYESERDSVMKSFLPYFTYDKTVEEKHLEALSNDMSLMAEHLQQSMSERSQQLITDFMTAQLKNIYEHGLIENEVRGFEPLKDKAALIKVDNNQGTEIPVSSIYSLKSAYVELESAIASFLEEHLSLKGTLRQIDMNQYLEPNLIYDEASSEMHLSEMLEVISTTRGVIQSGVRIISQGDIVTAETFQILESLKYSYLTQSAYSGWVSLYMTGQLILVLILLFLIVFYIRNFDPHIFNKKRNFSLIVFSIVIFFLFSWLISGNPSMNLYIVPLCILPIILRTFLGPRLAILVHVTTTLLIGFLAPNSFEYVFIQTVAGIFAVINLNKMYRRGHLVVTSVYLFFVYAVLYLGFSLLKEGSFESIRWMDFRWFAMSSVFTLIAYPLIYVFERIFGFVSDVTLMELSDTNMPLLRKLAELAPGTFQHSMQVANLAEEVVIRIGGNPMLIRAGALYHDVGKIKKSLYFIENQQPGMNPHEKLSYVESASIIIDHVKDGVEIARKHNVPEMIIDFIRTHHGRGVARYFYLKYKEENPNEQIDMSQFSYPGPNPHTRETAIVMLADGVEAAARSLPEKTEENLKNLIDRIIDTRLKDHELDDAPLTLRDIKMIKSIFLEKLRTIYHIRIQYPEEKA